MKSSIGAYLAAARTAYWHGKKRWIEGRAAALQRIRGMTAGEAIAKAKDEWEQFKPEPAKKGGAA